MADAIDLHEADDGMFAAEEEGAPDLSKGLQSRAARAKNKQKGRGFQGHASAVKYNEQQAGGAPGAPQRSVEGWIILVTNVHEEADEEHLMDKFSEYGKIKSLTLNLDRQTGYVKGYCLIEYETYNEADAAVNEGTGIELLGQVLSVNFAFVRGNQGR